LEHRLLHLASALSNGAQGSDFRRDLAGLSRFLASCFNLRPVIIELRVSLWPQRLQWFVNWFQHMTAGVNWYRIAFIFLPAIIRGELSAITLYLPFIFGMIIDLKDIVVQTKPVCASGSNFFSWAS
jgi:hypothetical protein